jgi:hypothetical protein
LFSLFPNLPSSIHPFIAPSPFSPSLLSPLFPQRLGYYDPLRKETNLNAPAIKKWLALGAQPSETVGRLLAKAMITAEE